MAIYKLILKKGKKKDLPKLAQGEPGFTTDTKELYVGSDSGNIPIAKSEDVKKEDQRLDKKIEQRAAQLVEELRAKAKGIKDALAGLARVVDQKAEKEHEHEEYANKDELPKKADKIHIHPEIISEVSKKADREHDHPQYAESEEVNKSINLFKAQTAKKLKDVPSKKDISDAVSEKAELNHRHRISDVANLQASLKEKLTDLTDTPSSYTGEGGKYLKVKSTEDGVEFDTVASSADFTDLGDVPAAYTGAGNKLVSVKADESGLEFTTAAAGVTEFTDLSDVPNAYTGQAGKFPKVKATEDGLEFAAVTTTESDPVFTGALDTDGTLNGNSDTKVASQKATKTYADGKLAKATNVTSVNDTGIADGEIAVFNLTNKDIRTSDKTITTTLGADDSTVPTSKAVKDVTDGKVTGNAAITGATKTKITYDAKGLVTAGADATTADISDSTNKRYVTDAQLTVIGNTSGTNSGDETTSTIKTKLGAAATGADGYLTSTDWNTFNGKQAALGYTPENVANKSTDGTLGDNSDTDYPSEKAVKTYADTKIAKATNVTAINDTGIADGEIALFNLTNKDIRTSDKTITTTLGTDDATIPTSKAVKDVTDTKITAFADPDADRIVFWDDSAGAFAALQASTGLTISTTSMTVRAASTSQTGIAELATNAEFTTGTDTSRFVSANQVANISQTMANKTLTSPVINTGVSGTAVLDEDNMASNSATQLATQQSIKAYADTKIAKATNVTAINDTGIADGEIAVFNLTNKDVRTSGVQFATMFPTGVDAWDSFTPSWANVTVGNGTSTGYYCQIGKTVFFRASFTMGTTSSISGAVTLTLPVAIANYPNYTLIGNCTMFNGSSAYLGFIHKGGTIYSQLTNATYSTQETIDATHPFTWANTHYFSVTGAYEAA